MMDYKCGKCGKEYTFEERRKLPMIQAVESDTNPKEEHGFTCVCKKCGYIFGKDRMRLQKKIKIKLNQKEVELTVSTVFLELNHSGYYYETMIFGDGINCDYQERYETKKEAKIGHKVVVTKLKYNNFEIKPTEYTLFVNDAIGETESKNE